MNHLGNEAASHETGRNKGKHDDDRRRSVISHHHHHPPALVRPWKWVSFPGIIPVIIPSPCLPPINIT